MVLGCLAILNHRFWLFVLATTQIGIFQGFSNYIRYTAAESVEISDKSKAISFVMLGGVLAAVIGPNLAKYSREWIEGAEFAGSYGAVIILYVLILFVLSFLNLDEKGQSLQKDAQGKLSPDTGRPLLQIAMQPNYIIAMVSGMIGYGVMSFVMTATPLAMSQHAFIFNDTSFVIQWHVLAMFAPSFFTGSLIVRFGVIKVMICGAILGLACVLINFLFVGATTMITDTYEAKEKNKAQALNDFAVFTTVAVASLSAGALQNLYGWKIVNIGVLPLLAIVVVALLWLSRKHRYLSLAQIEVLEESTLSGSN